MRCFATFMLAAVLSMSVLKAEAESMLLLKGRATILEGDQRTLVLQQCSRPAPQGVTGFWQPSKADVTRLENALPDYLKGRKAANEQIPPAGQSFMRQYAGFTRHGRRFIYGNFYASFGENPDQASRVCDGGDDFWGIEFDVEKGTFLDIEFNGAI